MQCLHCNKAFIQRQADHKFCSKHCNSTYRRNSFSPCVIKDCEQKSVTISLGLCHFHYRRAVAGLDLDVERSIRTRGTGTLDKKGYIVTRIGGVAKFVHRMIAEKALGKPLPDEAQVHHLNEKKWDNANTNLVVYPNDDYHKLLHRRTKELGIVFE